jgi:UDP-N-acetylglucosamine 2-epimerase (non-hydrolysing)
MGANPAMAGPVLCVVGARPNFMKMAPLLAAFARDPGMPRAVLVHTGQHYDAAMSDKLFADLQLPAPDLTLEVGSGTHAVQTAEIMRRFEPLLDQYQPSAVLVVGDVNSTLACSLVAAKKHVPVVHVEAGLRSFDRAMPEEINRVLTDQISDLLYTPERSAATNLARKYSAGRIAFVGIDDRLAARQPPARRAVGGDAAPRRLDPPARVTTGVGAGFGVVTLHRPANVDRPDTLRECLEILRAAADKLPLICALHPRTRGNVDRFGLAALLATPAIAVLPPQGYLEMLGLMAKAAVVLTDSGGMQEETTALGVPCLTLRESTERPITVDEGTNTIVGRDRALTLRLLDEIPPAAAKRGRAPELWDGHAAERIAAHLGAWIGARHATRGA